MAVGTSLETTLHIGGMTQPYSPALQPMQSVALFHIVRLTAAFIVFFRHWHWMSTNLHICIKNPELSIITILYCSYESCKQYSLLWLWLRSFLNSALIKWLHNILCLYIYFPYLLVCQAVLLLISLFGPSWLPTLLNLSMSVLVFPLPSFLPSNPGVTLLMECCMHVHALVPVQLQHIYKPNCCLTWRSWLVKDFN